MCREIFRTIAERQVRGLMFHSDMADYYAFLDLKPFRDFHNKQYIEESETLREIKDYFIDKNHQTLILGSFGESLNITPIEWENKTTMDVDKNTSKVLLKQSLEKYHEWEEETYNIYLNAANQLFERGYYEEYSFVKCLVDDVILEKAHNSSIAAELAAVDYDITQLKCLNYKLQ